MYRTLVQFVDLKDGNHLYKVGDEYPRSGYSASEKRIKELSTGANRRHKPLIEEIKEKEVEVVEEKPARKPRRKKKLEE